MKILFVADASIAGVTSGSERVLHEECVHLTRRGHDVHLLTRRLQHHASDAATINGVREWRYLLPSKRIPQLSKSTLVDCRLLFDSIKSKYSFDILNIHQPVSGLGVLSSSSSHTLPIIYTCHSLWFEEYASRSNRPATPLSRLVRWFHLIGRKLLERSILKRSNLVVTLSEYTREKLRKVHGLPGETITVIPGGVDLGRFKPVQKKTSVRRQLGIPQDRFVLFTLRNLEPRMGVENLVLAFQKILAERADAFLVIGGDGPLSPALEDLVRESGVAESTELPGHIAEEHLPAYYQMADLFILPTLELEGFGLVTVEALASGLPVLGTPIGGTREILAHLGSGFLFADSTPEAMSLLILDAMQTWAKDPMEYRRISQKCCSVAERHYSWDAHITKLESLLQGAVH